MTINKIVFTDADDSPSDVPDAITSNPFWPEISIKQYRATMNVDKTVADIRVKAALINGIATTNAELKGFRLAALQAGITKLAEIDADEVIDGETLHSQNYRRAVFNFAHVDVLEQYATFAATDASSTRAEAKQEQANDYRRNAYYAITDIRGQQRCDSELI